MSKSLTSDYLEEVRKRCDASTKGLWIASVEGRDHPLGGETVILRGVSSEENVNVREEDDFYLIGGTVADYDFVAHAKQDIPLLLDEISRLKKLLENR
jgi:hypothetical protein